MAARLTILSVCLFSACVFAANPNEYKGGSGESVKNWGARDYEQITKSQLPLFIYISDEGFKTNQRAKIFENELLGNADVKAKLKPFTQIRMDSDGARAKGWTKDWLNRASNGAAILIISSDLRFPIWIDKSTPKEQLKPDHLMRSIQMVVDYEAKKREATELAEKKNPKKKEEDAEEKPKEDPKKGFGGFLDDKEKDKGAMASKDGGKDKVAKKEEAPKKKKEEPLDE